MSISITETTHNKTQRRTNAKRDQRTFQPGGKNTYSVKPKQPRVQHGRGRELEWWGWHRSTQQSIDRKISYKSEFRNFAKCLN